MRNILILFALVAILCIIVSITSGDLILLFPAALAILIIFHEIRQR